MVASVVVMVMVMMVVGTSLVPRSFAWSVGFRRTCDRVCCTSVSRAVAVVPIAHVGLRCPPPAVEERRHCEGQDKDDDENCRQSVSQDICRVF